MPGCAFSDKWLSQDKYRSWIAPMPSNRHKARCKLCSKDIELGSMGEAALVSHMASKKHGERAKLRCGLSISNFLPSSRTAASSTATSSAAATPDLRNCDGVTTTQTLSAEIYWALNVVTKHQSFRSSDKSAALLQKMFPDSGIAAKFSCGERKCNYLSTFGLAPYFESLLLSNVKNSDYVVLFDESLNYVTQSKQLDVLVRIWDVDRVSTRYFTSKFLGHARAETLVDELLDSCHSLGLSGLLQVSMDGPSVNWKAFDLLNDRLKADVDRKLFNAGSCGLHTIHNAFSAGIAETTWDIEHAFTSLYWLFKDSPARRDDFTQLTGSNLFGRNFCKTR
eukprot:scpid71843/ scgid19539/ 